MEFTPQCFLGSNSLHCGFSVSRSDRPASRNPVDLTIEQTINRHANARASYVETKLEMTGMTCSKDTAHKDLRSPKIRRGEKDLQTLITAFHNLINPFDFEANEDLFCVSSGARAQAEVANDILNAEAVGNAAFKTFIQQRLVPQTLKFGGSLPRQSLKALGSPEKTKKLKSSKIVQISAQQNLFGQLLIFL